MKPEAKGKAHMIEEDVSSPRKRARKTTNQQDEGPGTTVRTFNTEQEDCLYDLYTNKTKLCDIHDFFVREYDFEGNEKSLKSYFFKLKAQRTSLSDEDVRYMFISLKKNSKKEFTFSFFSLYFV